MKLLFSLFTGLIALVLICALMTAFLLWRTDLNNYKTEIEEQADQQGIALKLVGSLGWSLYPVFGIRADNFTVQASPDTPVISFNSLMISIQLKPLLQKEFVIQNLQLDGGSLLFEQEDSQNTLLISKLMLKTKGANIQQQDFPIHFSFSLSSQTLNAQKKYTTGTTLPIIGHAALSLNAEQLNAKAIEVQIEKTLLNSELAMHFANPSTLNVTLEGESPDISSLVQLFTYSDKSLIHGDLSFQAKLSNHEKKQKPFLETLKGEIDFKSKSLVLDEVDLMSSLDATLLQMLQAELPRFMDAENKTQMADVSGHVQIKQGIAKNTVLSAKGLCTEFKGQGNYSLLNSDINYKLGIIFPADSAEKICQEINPRLKDISWPIICNGSLSNDPADLCQADKKSINKILNKSLKKEAYRKANKSLDKKLDEKLGDNAEAAKQLLKQLFQ